MAQSKLSKDLQEAARVPKLAVDLALQDAYHGKWERRHQGVMPFSGRQYAPVYSLGGVLHYRAAFGDLPEFVSPLWRAMTPEQRRVVIRFASDA